MADSPLILIENKIPFIKNRLEQVARVKYLDPEEFTPHSVANADALIIRTRTHCDEDLLRNSSVKFIATATIGTDHIDLEWCRQKGITIANAPGCNAPAVAQYVWSSILHLGIDPTKSTIGIVGYGNVGKIVADYANQLGAKILLCDPPLQEQNIQAPFPFLSLEKMLPQCDIVTIHTPLTNSGAYPTYHMIDEKCLNLLNDGSTIINAARGPVVDTTELIKAIDHKNLISIIDCWENEPHIDLRLLDKAKIATPHIAGYSLEGKQRATRMAIEATLQYFGLPTIDLSDLEPPYTPKNITAQQITDSYKPLNDTSALKEAFRITKKDYNSQDQNRDNHNYWAINEQAQVFERLRADYTYRPEP